jgi:hypothetical protein
LVDEFQASERGCLDFDDFQAREVVIDRKRFIRECWTAFFGLASDESPSPPRKFHWSGGSDEIGVWEHSGLDTEQETRWFQEEFAEQLKKLAEVYGCDPTIKWGVVTKFS